MKFDDFKKTDKANSILNKVKRKLKNRGFEISDLSNEDIFDEIEDAIESVNNRRHFIPTEEQLFEDKYIGIVIRLVICSYAKMGAEGELAHSENGVSRTYTGASEHPNDILKEIVPLARIKEL